jgi:tRNA (guanine37-N1)-methyltransferase
MKIDILTIFPNMFKSPFAESIIKRAQEAEKVTINIHNLRKWTTDKHKTVDDKPFGGGAGMVMMIEPIYKALKELDPDHKAHRILFTAKAKRIMQGKVRGLSKRKHLILICGHYEGVDHRVHEHLVDECISIGDFVLTGGEIPAMALTDAVVRLLPGVLGNEASLKEESFSRVNGQMSNVKCFLEYPQYTRPAVFKAKSGKELKVPEILLSGDHERIAKWRESKKRPVRA